MSGKSKIGSAAKVTRIVEPTAGILSETPQEPLSVIESMMKDLHGLKVQDIEQQLHWRPKVLEFTAKVIVWQYIVVFALIFVALITDTMKDLSLVFGTLVGGTLLQTAYVAKVMVRFLFKDIDYKYDGWFDQWRGTKKKKSKSE